MEPCRSSAFPAFQGSKQLGFWLGMISVERVIDLRLQQGLVGPGVTVAAVAAPLRGGAHRRAVFCAILGSDPSAKEAVRVREAYAKGN